MERSRSSRRALTAEFRGSRRDLSAVAASDSAPNGRSRSEGPVHAVIFAFPDRDLDANALGGTMFFGRASGKEAREREVLLVLIRLTCALAAIG